MNLSKSKYCMGIQCIKQLWLENYKCEVKENINNDTTLDNGIEVGIVAKDLLGKHIDISYNDDLNVMIEDTKNALLNNQIIITEASFEYQNNFCSVDVLKKEFNKISIYEVKSSTEIKDIYIDDIAYQYFVLNSLNYVIDKCFIVYIDNEYIRKGKLELNKLFKIVDVTQLVLEKQNNVQKNIKIINEHLKKVEEPDIDIGMHCVKPYDCPYFKYCIRHLPLNNIFKLRRMNNKEKFKYYHLGKYQYNDLINEDIDWKIKQQIEFELYNKNPIINYDKIREFLNQLCYPLYFLDFETFQQSIPQYDYIKPYMQIPFQYSLHYIEKENTELIHKEYLADYNVDPRRSLAEKLVSDIPKNSCIIAYNMMFEKMVIKNLAELFLDLHDHLMNIYDNMHDLMIPFKNRDYYTKEMSGSYSIKYVLPALFPNEQSLNYHNLDMIHNGSEAMNSYMNLEKFSKVDQDKVKHNLLKYCELDTYAMVKIWEKLREVSDNN